MTTEWWQMKRKKKQKRKPSQTQIIFKWKQEDQRSSQAKPAKQNKTHSIPTREFGEHHERSYRSSKGKSKRRNKNAKASKPHLVIY